MQFRTSVTFEFPTQAPETTRTAIVAGKAETAAHRALRAAKKAMPNRKPTSIVVLLEPEREC